MRELLIEGTVKLFYLDESIRWDNVSLRVD
jgi:hypothetical protein